MLNRELLRLINVRRFAEGSEESPGVQGPWLTRRPESRWRGCHQPAASRSPAQIRRRSERFEERAMRATLHRLRGMVLAAMGAEETQIEALFQTAINIARQQKSVSLEKRAETTYAEYRRQKASGSGARGFRLSLC